MGKGGQRHDPAALPTGKTRYPLYRRLGGPQGRSGQMRKISPPPGFDPRTVQLVVSRYTDWATRPTVNKYIIYHYTNKTDSFFNPEDGANGFLRNAFNCLQEKNVSHFTARTV